VDEKDLKEASTAISFDDAAALKPNLATKRDLDQWEYRNILEARSWALDSRRLGRSNPLTESYIRELHFRMFNQTWRWAGRFRTSNQNLGIPFGQICEQLAQLLGDAGFWVENKTFDIQEIAVRFHHRIVWIHPFPNGNGRHARLIADVIAMKWGCEPFSWGPSDLIAAGAARDEYIKALKTADNNGDIKPLLLFARS
jgi:Fic-DOC domain mobile mystery protein B